MSKLELIKLCQREHAGADRLRPQVEEFQNELGEIYREIISLVEEYGKIEPAAMFVGLSSKARMVYEVMLTAVEEKNEQSD